MRLSGPGTPGHGRMGPFPPDSLPPSAPSLAPLSYFPFHLTKDMPSPSPSRLTSPRRPRPGQADAIGALHFGDPVSSIFVFGVSPLPDFSPSLGPRA